MKQTLKIISFVLSLVLFAGTFASCSKPGNVPDFYDKSTQTESVNSTKQNTEKTTVLTTSSSAVTKTVFFEKFSLSQIPEYNGKPYVTVNNNTPFFKENEITKKSYEYYCPLDSLLRCGVASACIGKDLMPTEKRGEIGSVKPTGWCNKKYDFVDGGYLYNRCHLIGYQLSGENANEKNLITGTRYMNVDGMLPFENMVADYVKETKNHVMYRVTPVFDGYNLLASGVLMEAYSVEDDGDGVLFCVFCYNVQPGVKIDYKTGENTLDKNYAEKNTAVSSDNGAFILNTKSKKIHKPTCSSVNTINEENKKKFKGNIGDLLKDGYSKCGSCFK